MPVATAKIARPTMRSSQKDIFYIVKPLGYRTGLAGKNHSYLKPSKLDFWREYTHLKGWQPSNPSKEAVDFIQSSGTQPFALWMSFPEPHNPYQVSEPYFSMFPPDQVPQRKVGPGALDEKGFNWHWLRGLEGDASPGYDSEWRRTRSNYLGMLRLIDDQLKRLVDFLEQKGIRDNTVIVYLSDHGDYFCDYGLIHKGVGMPEDLIRIPMVGPGPGINRQDSLNDVFVSTADLIPTICEALGAQISPGAQGRSLWPLLQNQPYLKEEFRSAYSEVSFGDMYST